MPPPKKPTEQPKNNERNEYIPSFISKKPFYIDDATASEDDYLEHQRLQSLKNHDPLATSQWYDRGHRVGPAATKYRKGACENCGAMTHKAKDCLQRRRAKGAKWTGRDIQADEVVQDVKLGWDAKRDRWNGYKPEEYQEVVEEYNALEEMKKAATGDATDADTGDRYEEETDMGRQQATSTRNLRLREDTAKYLLNLDLDSAKYDPKTRSMLEAGTVAGGRDEETVAEEGFQRASGDAREFERAQKYAWETQERGEGDKVHLQANPTAGELTRKRQREEDELKKETNKKALLDKYGGQEHLQQNKKAVAISANEAYVEYDDRGKIKGAPERKEKSVYAEDVLVNNHTSVWGSWWRDFKWGYACCHSTVKNSYCTGEEGLKAIEDAERFAKGVDLPSVTKNTVEEPKAVAWANEQRNEEFVPNGVERDVKARKDDETVKKRTLEEMRGGVNEEEMEAYRRSKVARDDPMAKMLAGEAEANISFAIE